jgi:hypothetical protein
MIRANVDRSLLRSYRSFHLLLNQIQEVYRSFHLLRGESQMDGFRNGLEVCRLSDLGFMGPKFTWNNGRSDDLFTMERLDRGGVRFSRRSRCIFWLLERRSTIRFRFVFPPTRLKGSHTVEASNLKIVEPRTLSGWMCLTRFGRVIMGAGRI